MLDGILIENKLEEQLLHRRLSREEINKVISRVLDLNVEVLDQDLRNEDATNDFRFDIAMSFNKELDLFGCIFYLKTNQEDLLYITEVSNFEFQ